LFGCWRDLAACFFSAVSKSSLVNAAYGFVGLIESMPLEPHFLASPSLAGPYLNCADLVLPNHGCTQCPRMITALIGQEQVCLF
jgi:hypothetical protein